MLFVFLHHFCVIGSVLFTFLLWLPQQFVFSLLCAHSQCEVKVDSSVEGKKRIRQTKPIHPSPLSLLVICLQFYVLFNLIRRPGLLSQKNVHKEFHLHWLCDLFPFFTRHTETRVVQIHFSVPKINADPQQTSRCTAAVHACVHGEEGNVFVSLCVQNLQLPVVGLGLGRRRPQYKVRSFGSSPCEGEPLANVFLKSEIPALKLQCVKSGSI